MTNKITKHIHKIFETNFSFSKKATKIDTISPKLIKKVAVDFLTPFLTKSINSSIENKIFSDLAETTLVAPLDKRKPYLNDISNFPPVAF